MLQYDRKKVGQFFRLHREKSGLTQAQVARKVGYGSPQFISNIERGISVAPLALMATLLKLYRANGARLTKIILASQEALLLQKIRKYS